MGPNYFKLCSDAGLFHLKSSDILDLNRLQNPIKDHLGNIRITFADLGGDGMITPYLNDEPHELLSERHYYPFGMEMAPESKEYIPAPTTTANRYTYNGKELVQEMGLDWLAYGARSYDPAIGRFTGVDPEAALMPAWSPYSYVFNNPLNYIDPDGRIPYPITIRSFAPFKSFGGGFHGDNRGFSNTRSFSDGRGPSARVHQVINFDTDKTRLTTDAWSSPTLHKWRPSFKRTSTPSISIGDFNISSSGDAKTFNFDTHYAGSNPLTPGAPPIDVFSNFSITENKKAGTLDINGKLTGDNFPSTEAFISDPSGQNIFIGVGFYEGSPFSSLWGENKDNPITDFSFSITTNSDGNFTGVKVGDTDYSISDWNNLFLNADPHKNADK